MCNNIILLHHIIIQPIIFGPNTTLGYNVEFCHNSGATDLSQSKPKTVMQDSNPVPLQSLMQGWYSAPSRYMYNP